MASASAAALSVSDSLRANRSGPILGSAKPSASASCADSQVRCSVSASSAAGRTWASRAAHCGAASSAASISLLTSAIVPSNCPIAVSRCTRGIRPSCRRASASTAGNLRQPPGDRTQPVGQRREVPGQQLVDGLARVGEQRVPGVLAQLVDLEHPPGHAVRHHRGVHPVLGRQGAAVDRGEPRGPAVERTAVRPPGPAPTGRAGARRTGGRPGRWRCPGAVRPGRPGTPGPAGRTQRRLLIAPPFLRVCPTVANEMMARCACWADLDPAGVSTG